MDGQTVAFRYDAAHERVTKSGPGETVTTFAGLDEKHATAAQRDTCSTSSARTKPSRDVSYTEAAQPSQPGTTTIAYPLTDALGSTDAVADEHGTVAERDYYDSWGQRSTPDGLPLAQPTLFQSLVSAGFTSQDHDDNLALINMQGRLYDPALGRFLSADPIIGNPAFSQSWNAYSYVNNSPLNFTDPSGFDCYRGAGGGDKRREVLHRHRRLQSEQQLLGRRRRGGHGERCLARAGVRGRICRLRHDRGCAGRGAPGGQ